MTQIKSVVLIGSAHPFRGGLAAYNERLIREFIKEGYEASIYTFSLQYPSFLFPGKTQFSSEPSPKDLTVLRKVNSINPFNWIRVGLELKKMKPDLVIVKFWMPFMAPCFGTICRIIKRNRHTRIVSIIDNIIPHEKRTGDTMLAQYWVNSANGFVTMSKNVQEKIKSFLKKKFKPVVYCPHPLYDNFGEAEDKIAAKKKLGLTEKFNYILFFGFIRDYKGLDLLLQAFADERFRNLPLRLLVAGEFYCDPKPYYDVIEKTGIKERVILSNDFIPDSSVVHYFCASDIVVQPYKNATQSGVTQIAYHFNKPMIITNVGGLAEFVPHGKTGYVVNPEPSEIAQAILDFYSGNKEEEFSANAAIEKLKYSWHNMVEAVKEAAG